MMGLRRRSAPFLFGLLLSACASTGNVQDIQPGERPDLASDEAGLWMKMDRFEAELRDSGQLVDDPALGAYLERIVCELALDYCQDIRIYLVRTPGFNASMAPNGAMVVWSGLLLRCENEAQLAYVLGHELAHYIERHSLKRWRDLRATTNGLAFFQFATAITGLGVVGDLATLGAMGSIMAFSRDHEREADRIGLQLAQRAGYSGAEAAKIWDYLQREKEAAEDGDSFIFFASHPPSEERRDTLAALAQTRPGKGRVGSKEYHKLTVGHRMAWLRDELQLRDYSRIEALTAHLLDSGIDPGPVHFLRGEVYRLRDQEGDTRKALAAYHAALKTRQAPAETYRSLGLVLWSMDEPGKAQSAFRQYIRRRPKADDRAMVEDYINQLN
ncbi:MAG: M48 family metalloprotease [Kiloniellales bacterium]|nr:M48 family metalloprotease [Kiloniellales bacterium]MDJ0970623.1 M48 family metalloprotease [Kiloniellales bacterium]